MKIAVCVPAYGGAKPAFVQSLANLIAHTLRANVLANGAQVVPELETFVGAQTSVSIARNTLLDQALRWAADYTLWLDADHVFPRDTLLRLLRHEVALVGLNQPRRSLPITPTAVVDGKLLWPNGEELQEVDSIGFGVCLLNMKVMPVLQDCATAREIPLWPLFKEEWSDGPTATGEDRYFCSRMKAAGLPVHIDHRLSFEVAHIAETELRFARRGRNNADAVLPSAGAQ